MRRPAFWLIVLIASQAIALTSPFFPIEQTGVFVYQRNEWVGFNSPTVTTTITYGSGEMLDATHFSRAKSIQPASPTIDTCVLSLPTVACSDSVVYHVPSPPFLNSPPRPVVSGWAGSLNWFYIGKVDSFYRFDSSVTVGVGSDERLQELYKSGIGLVYRIHTNYERISPKKHFFKEDILVSVRGKPVNYKAVYDSLTKSTTHVSRSTQAHSLPVHHKKIDALGRGKSPRSANLFFSSISNILLTGHDTPRH